MRRVISAAVVAAGTLALCLLVPPWVRQLAILLAAAYACREAIRMAGAIHAPEDGPESPRDGKVPPAGLAATVVLMLLVAGFGVSSGPSAVPLAAMSLLAVAALVLPATPRTLGWLGAAALAALWIGFPTAALLALTSGEDGGRTLLFLLATVMVGEAGAFFGGKLIGGPRLAPALSPGKTWAGFVAQLAFGGAAGAAAVPLLSSGLGPGIGSALGVGISAAAALGDLFESFWKRASGRKDSGRIIPGHGGLLDRIDGVLFGALALLAASVFVPL
ncbi:MAG: phosphatidate cytidylyltransferase [Acidobacteria bacterium]|nr:phosphatidate cytidylyltransferase [Acidobacteriota bacterium]MYF13705.1 phosphatidate cytidylyltransferase [Acidobacteriota bacterium]MYI97966.1 phosphatidate cytidylyltransferase [Acidobacteriota bacterium]